VFGQGALADAGRCDDAEGVWQGASMGSKHLGDIVWLKSARQASQAQQDHARRWQLLEQHQISEVRVLGQHQRSKTLGEGEHSSIRLTGHHITCEGEPMAVQQKARCDVARDVLIDEQVQRHGVAGVPIAEAA
jgi:hypothetical protein